MKSLIEYIKESNNIELMSDGNEHGFEYVDLVQCGLLVM